MIKRETEEGRRRRGDEAEITTPHWLVGQTPTGVRAGKVLRGLDQIAQIMIAPCCLHLDQHNPSIHSLSWAVGILGWPIYIFRWPNGQ